MNVRAPRGRGVAIAPHGYVRASDRPAREGGGPAVVDRGTGAPASVLSRALVVPLVGMVAALVGVGAVRVRTQCRILELGEDIAALATEQAGLLDLKGRLEAERAYLRHPDHVREVAEQRLDMVPVDPAWVRTIRTVAEETP